MLAGEQISSYMIKLCIIILINEIHWLREIHTESSTWVVCNCIKKSNAASPSDPNSLFGLSAKGSSIFPSKDLQTLIWLMGCAWIGSWRHIMCLATINKAVLVYVLYLISRMEISHPGNIFS